MQNIAKQDPGQAEELRRTIDKLHATRYKPFPAALYVSIGLIEVQFWSTGSREKGTVS